MVTKHLDLFDLSHVVWAPIHLRPGYWRILYAYASLVGQDRSLLSHLLLLSHWIFRWSVLLIAGSEGNVFTACSNRKTKINEICGYGRDRT